MDQQAILQADYIDILYDNRNKSYGGYALRLHYRRRLISALTAVALLTCGASILIATGNKPSETPTVYIPPIEFSPVIDIIPVAPPAAAAPPPPEDVTNVNAIPVIVEDKATDAVEVEKETEVDITDANLASEPFAGTGTNTGNGSGHIGELGDNAGNEGSGKIAAGSTVPVEPLRYATEMPSFKGDLQEYLQKHLRYPGLARENNIEGRVSVEFVVNEDGSISHVRILKGIGGGCDEEAVRVVRAMLPWKAGKMNDRKVKIMLILPIVFKLS